MGLNGGRTHQSIRLIVAIQQPEHLPWMGFFNKMVHCDRFVLLDTVQFKRRYFENRNKIRAGDAHRWITVPVRSSGRFTQSICDVEIDNEEPWRGRYRRSILHAYARTPFFRDHASRFDELVDREWEHLIDLNIAMIELVREILGIDTPMVRASEVIRSSERGSDLLLAICCELGASRYVSGPDGRSYLALDGFSKAGIAVDFHDYEHPRYGQSEAPFVSHLSILDLIFNQGPESARWVSEGTR